jgi:hypothetical protein
MTSAQIRTARQCVVELGAQHPAPSPITGCRDRGRRGVELDRRCDGSSLQHVERHCFTRQSSAPPPSITVWCPYLTAS